jgi:membrane-bound lytic murein transglycosylase B
MRFVKHKSILLLIFCAMVFAPAANANPTDFQTWVETLKSEAFSKGIKRETLDRAFEGVQPLPRVIELDRKQPESTMTFAKYKQNVVTQDRVNKGRQFYQDNRQLLDGIAKQYGVPAQYIVALWGIETSYGENTGGFGVIPALATLAYDGRRSGYFRGELMNALRILDQGHINLENMRGSWAGAMGQNQFMPSSFIAYAADGNGDGRRDIWTSLPDVFASTANYLSESGWKNELKWGREVSLPPGMLDKNLGLENVKFMSDWRDLGVTLPNGTQLPVIEKTKASIVMPDGKDGPAFLVYDNYRVIMKWNKSIYFATSVGILADRISQ